MELNIKNSPQQALAISAFTTDGRSRVISSTALGLKPDEQVMVTVDVPEEIGEQRLNIQFFKKGFGFIIPVLKAGDHLVINSDLGPEGVINYTTFSGSERTKEVFDGSKKVSDLYKLRIQKSDQRLSAIISGKGDTIALQHQIDSITAVLISTVKKQVLTSESPTMVGLALASARLLKVQFSPEDHAGLRNKFAADSVMLKGIDAYDKSNTSAPAVEKVSYSAPLVGSRLTNFTLPDLEGKLTGLSKFKGKYVLVDFWASWCAPCREEMPNLKEALKLYGKDNFMILSVSIDESDAGWRKAIAQDGTINFVHLIADKGWASPIVKDMKITGLPTNFLLDPTGKIIGKDLRGKEMILFVKDKLKKK
ncbi:hypothetical protein GCM10028827_39170 [Mucilaginibacter myungsuensis]